MMATPFEQLLGIAPPMDEGPDPAMLDPNFGAPQEPIPNDFLARLAQGSGPQPFGPVRLGQKPTGLEVLLTILSGAVNQGAGQGARRVNEAQQRNQQARDAAKTLATWRQDERRARQQQQATRENVLLSRTPSARPAKSLEQIEAEAKARAAGTRAGAPPVTRTAPKAKPGPVMPELSAAASNLGSESQAFAQRGQTAEADSTRNLAGRIKDVHAAIRQAQTAEDVRNIVIPDGTPESVMAKIRMAASNRLRQIGATR